ncbi:MAG TPA: hypothetical protein DCM28_15575 [Phycisphaerales bacterium]|nr:hypothetical protein [Phycisphaerales bacterium]
MKYIYFLMMTVCLIVAMPARAQHQDQAWDFAKNTQQWQVWGRPPKPSEEQEKSIKTAVTWDGQMGCQAKGALKVTDDDEAMGCYAVSAMLPLDDDRAAVYTFAGKAHWDKSKPEVFAMFVTAKGEFKGIVASTVGNFSKVDDNDWSSFELTVPASRIPQQATHVRLAVRPASNYESRNLFTGTVWVDDVSWAINSAKPLSLESFMNRGLTDDAQGNGGWTNQGNNDLRGLTVREIQVQGVTFQLADPSDNANRAVIALRHDEPSVFAEQVHIPIATTRFDRLCLLHTAAWASDTSQPMGFVDFHYDNNDVISVPLYNGKHLADWWGGGSASQAYAVPVENPSPVRSEVLLYATEIANPRPDAIVKVVTFRAGETRSIWLILAANLANGPSQLQLTLMSKRDISNWLPFMPAVAKTSEDSVDLSFLLDAPAGKHGAVQVNDAGHFQFEDGTPARFWATNIHSNLGLFPTHQQAQMIAQTLARIGCNLVRLHLLESALLRTDLPTSNTWVGDEQLDRFDYLIKSLKDQGVYVMLDSITGLSSHHFKEADGIANFDQYYSHKSWAFYDPALRKMGHAFMHKLLTHTNRYTGNTLATEPAIAMALLINEQSVFWDWRLDSQPEYYKQELKKQYNQWLVDRYNNKDGLAKAWRLADGKTALKDDEDPAKGTVALSCDYVGGKMQQTLGQAIDPSASPAKAMRAAENVRFFQYLQTHFASEFIGKARQLGTRYPIMCTNIYYDMAELQTALPTRVVSQNAYWDHPHFNQNENTVGMRNKPEVSVNPLAREKLTESVIYASRIANTALISTETDTMWPHEWRSSHMMLNAAYGALGKVDGVFMYAYAGGWGFDWDKFIPANAILKTSIQYNDPAVISSFMAGAFLYLRGDVAPAKSVVRLQVSDQMTLAADGVERARNASFPANYLPYVSRMELTFPGQQVSSLEQPGLVLKDTLASRSRDAVAQAVDLDKQLKAHGIIPPNTGLADGRLTSDTGQLVRDWQNQYATVNTPLSQGCTGFVGKQKLTFDDLTISCQTPFATLMLSSLDNEPLSTAKRMFLIAIARADNADNQLQFGTLKTTPQSTQRGEYMTFDDVMHQGPVRIEPVMADITLKAEGLMLTPLKSDMTANHQAKQVFASHDGLTTLQIGKQGVSAWYLVQRISTQK